MNLGDVGAVSRYLESRLQVVVSIEPGQSIVQTRSKLADSQDAVGWALEHKLVSTHVNGVTHDARVSLDIRCGQVGGGAVPDINGGRGKR